MERYTGFIILLAVCLTTSISQPTFATDGSLKQCQNYSKKIDYYSALRRTGGSAKTMEKWKQKRNDYKDRIRDKNCKKWGSKLK